MIPRLALGKSHCFSLSPDCFCKIMLIISTPERRWVNLCACRGLWRWKGLFKCYILPLVLLLKLKSAFCPQTDTRSCCCPHCLCLHREPCNGAELYGSRDCKFSKSALLEQRRGLCADGRHANLVWSQFRGACKAFASDELFAASISTMLLTTGRNNRTEEQEKYLPWTFGWIS